MQRMITMAVAVASMSASVSAHEPEQTDSLARSLQEIVVTAKQPATKLVGTTLVSTIPGSKLQDIGTALDVLAQLPMIQVVDDAVSIVGKGVPEIYIDGRQLQSEDELISLQSTDIKKIELLMAPGAIYGNDTPAVLKIATRHNFAAGLSLLERAEGKARRRLSANNLLDLNYRAQEWDFFLSGQIAHNNSLIKGTTTNRLVYDGVETIVGSSQHKSFPSTNGVVKAGFNYSKGSQSLGAYYRYHPEKGNFSNIGKEWLNVGPMVERDIHTMLHAATHRAAVYYENTFSGKYLLHFDGDYKTTSSANKVETSYPGREMTDVASTDTRRSSFWAGKLYITSPMAGGNFILGTQTSYTLASLDYVMLTPDISQYLPSSCSESRQISTAAFASWEKRWDCFSLSGGIRHEYVDYRFYLNGRCDKDVSRCEHLLSPDISLGYSFNEMSQVNLSYKMTPVKPPYSQLTGSLSYVGMHEIEGGNPALKEGHMHDIQLLGAWHGFMLQADYTRSIDTYAFVKRVYPAPALQLITHPVNADVSALDLCLVWSRPIMSWTPDIVLGMHSQWLEIDGTHYDRPVFSYYFDNIISLPKDILITLNASGQSQGDIHTNRFGATWFTLDASVSKSFLSKSLLLKLAATDIFSTSNNDWTMNTCGVMVNKRQTYDRRGVSLTITYRFNPRKSKYKGKDASQAEMDRL